MLMWPVLNWGVKILHTLLERFTFLRATSSVPKYLSLFNKNELNDDKYLGTGGVYYFIEQPKLLNLATMIANLVEML
jgi:hypothetical protein